MFPGAKEIEVKYRLDDPEELERALLARGVVLSSPVYQDDQAYAQRGWSYEQSKLGVTFARLRTENRRHIFTIKKPLDNEMTCLECETEVGDRDQMHAAILVMGFYPTVRIIKTRRTALLGEISFCLDDVEHAGTFLEVEKIIGPGESATDVQAELDHFVRSFGLAMERTKDTYDSLVRAALVSN